MNLKLTIGWLYPTLMSTYGDRGNILILQQRCVARGIDVNVLHIDTTSTPENLTACDIIVGGGAQDRQQSLVIADLLQTKKAMLASLFDKEIPGLFVCGSPQLLGHYYTMGDGQKLEGLGIFDMVTEHFGHDKPRCIGNTVGEISDEFRVSGCEFRNSIVGFENHGGRTYLGKGVKPFATISIGNGNNGEDGTEGAVYKNCIATYFHGPFLSKNPHIADWLIHTALRIKYKKEIQLSPLDDTVAWKAHDIAVQKANNK